MNIKMPTRDEISAAFEKGKPAIVSLFDTVGDQLILLASQLDKQKEIIEELKGRLSKDSHNSSKPPFRSGYKKPRRTESLREPGQRPNGGQLGHLGSTLIASETPDQTEIHEVEECEHCRVPLSDVEVSACEERQVFDIPAIRIEVTAHRASIKICPSLSHENRGQFPKGVNSSVQYGSGVKTWASYLTNQHFIPVERTAQIIEDLAGHHVSEAVIISASEELSEQIIPATKAVKERLISSEVLNLDESGLRVKGQLQWIHVTSTDKLTHYEIHAKRGQFALESAGILSHFKGTATHDHWKPYFKYEDCAHALCNAHHLRELKFVEKQYQQSWATSMAELLVEIKDVVAKTDNDKLSPEQLETFERRYDDIVSLGLAANPRSPPNNPEGSKKKRGPPSLPPPVNLLIRLRDFKTQVLAFMYDFRVPFDNNQAFSPVRMVKVKQKVSGCFRTVEGAQRFGRIRGYISTARKNAKNAFEAISEAFKENPFIPAP